jgi:hypothetical protein
MEETSYVVFGLEVVLCVKPGFVNEVNDDDTYGADERKYGKNCHHPKHACRSYWGRSYKVSQVDDDAFTTCNNFVNYHFL